MIATNKSRIANPVAERQLSVVGAPDRTVVVTIGKPRPDPDGDWVCAFRIDGIEDSRRHLAYGVDSIQALLIAIERARIMLDASGLDFIWQGGEPGDTGIPRTVPSFYGLAFARKIERHIEREVEQFGRSDEARSNRARKDKARTGRAARPKVTKR